MNTNIELTKQELSIIEGFREADSKIQLAICKLLNAPREVPKFDYNGVTTEKERNLVCVGAWDFYVLAENAAALLDDILSHFEYSGLSVRTEEYTRNCFLNSYEVIDAKLRCTRDVVDRICLEYDFLSGSTTPRIKRFLEYTEKMTKLLNDKE